MHGEQQDTLAPLTVFYSYAHEDERLCRKLEKHLSLLRQQGMITEWHDRQILPGTDWAHVIDTHLMTAQVILLLISPDFLASDYCYGVEMRRALERQAEGSAQVIPILLRPVDWESAPFAFLQCLPRDGRPVTQWNNQDEALVTVAKGLRAAIEQVHPRAPSLLKHQAQPLTVSRDRNRQRMLERVRRTWIVGVLEHSLHDAARIALGLREEPNVLANPWRLMVQEINRPEQPLPAGTRITEVYDEADGALLILGEPGAGKTTLLLELARDLLTRAHADEREPIPVVFNLSSWAQKRAPLADWLVEELYLRYQVPQTLGQTWVDNDQLLLLLDGLDEVTAAQRGACIQAINSYRQAHPLVPVVVCSRGADYLNQAQQLALQSAVVIQPLTAQQIDDYLTHVGEQAVSVRMALHDDPVLQELARTPLMLNILILAYQDGPPEGRVEGGSAQARQEQLFAIYVQHMLKRRGAETRYTPEQIMHWLSHLANQIKQQSQTIFYLEQMQPTWLPSHRMRGVYDRLAVRLPGVLMGVLISLSISVFISNGYFNLLYLIPITLLGGLLGWLLSEGSTPQGSTVNSGKARSALGSRFLQWLVIGALIGLGSGLSNGLSVGLSCGLCSILLQFLLGKNNMAEARPQTLSPARGTTWQRLIRRREVRTGLLVGLLVGLCFGLIFGLSDWLNIGLSDGRSFGLDTGLSIGPSVGLNSGLGAGLIFGLSAWGLSTLLIGRSTAVQPTDLLVWSWRSLGKSLFSKSHASTTMSVTALFGLSFGLIFGLSFGLSSGLDQGLDQGLSQGLSIGLNSGLSAGLILGLSYWLLLGLSQGVSGATIEDQHRMVPNQGIRRSALNGLLLGLISTMIVGLLVWLGFGLSNGLILGLIFGLSDLVSNSLVESLAAGLLAGLLVGLLVGLLNGGLASFRHYVVRSLLWRTGSVPLLYIPFLDYAAERILLCKVGGGYIFIHRLLHDYFASLETIPVPEESPEHVPSG